MKDYNGHKISTKVKINPLSVLGNTNLLAQATVIIDEVIEIHGWRVMKSKHLNDGGGNQLWIQEPSAKTNQGWKPIVYINDKGFYEHIKFEIEIAYKDTNDYEKSKLKNSDGELEEIPF
jgi:DNA-binding cell septation regulator SpoVG